MNPTFPLPVLFLLAALVLVFAVIGAWRGAAGLPPQIRTLLLGLRLAAIVGVLLILFNPGKWVRPTEDHTQPWILLDDVSASMAQPLADGTTRAAAATDLVGQTARAANDTQLPLIIHPFAAALNPAVQPDAVPPPTGTASNILPAISQTLQDAAAMGDSPAGILVLSDGRQTLASSQADLEALALRARSRNVPIHTVTLGGNGPFPDLVLILPRAALTAFAVQPLRIPFALKSSGLPPIRPVVSLRDATGTEISSLSLDLPPDQTVTATFEIKAPAASTQWSIDTPVIPSEARSSNNHSSINLRILNSKTRIFLAEGSPYWDSKFLAQLLRQQPHMDVQSVHQLSNQRFFRISSGTTINEETNHPVFPASLDELVRYDLVVFGKNVDSFMTAGRAEALRAFVRDRGGAVLFARGKPATTEIPALEMLEPVVWGSGLAADFRFAPTRDGEAAGLFGQALPAPDASLWGALPNLRDGRQIALVKPFTRVLAEGIADAAHGAAGGKFPALVVRRYGLGVTGLVNGDGLWKWDFFPEARELGNCYEDFWLELIQWMASYSEFLPGQDFSLRLPSVHSEAGVAMTAQISYRGPQPAPQPSLLATGPGGAETRIQPAAVTDPSGRPAWRASFTPDQPGSWKLSLSDPRDSAPPVPEVLVNVPPAPTESDDLTPDPVFLATIATATGGSTVASADFPAFLRTHLVKKPPAARESGAIWQPVWNHTLIALAIAALLATEWFVRRRQGLA